MKNTIHIEATRTSTAVTGVLSLVQGLLILIPTIVLGQAIGWPGSLGDPASVALPRLLEQESAVRFGYAAYALLSILFVVTVTILTRLSRGKTMARLMTFIVSFALASTVFRTIGIIRWLAPMPQLATSWADATTDQERYAISIAFDMLNAYGGTIGEVLGVSLFAAIALILLCIAAFNDRLFPTWLVGFGMIAAVALLASASELVGIDPGAVVAVLSTTLIQFWFMAAGVWLLIRSTKQPVAVS